MTAKSHRPNGQDRILLTLNEAINDLTLAKESTSVVPVQATFTSTCALVITIRDSMINRDECIKLGLACADVCRSLDQRMKARQSDEFSQPVLEAIERLTAVVVSVQRNVVKMGKRNVIGRFVHAKSDKRRIDGWKLDLIRILHVFEAELTIPTHETVPSAHDALNATAMASNTQQTALNTGDNTDIKSWAAHASVPGELTPPLPGSTQGTVSDIRRDALRNRAIVSELNTT